MVGLCPKVYVREYVLWILFLKGSNNTNVSCQNNFFEIAENNILFGS